MTQRKSFLGSLPITAAAFGRTFGVEVICGGSVPSTDGRTIRLPDVGAEIEEKTVLAWLGHECGHILATDFSVVHQAMTPFVHELLNALEDPRIEREIGREFGGMRYILRGFYEKQVRRLCTQLRRKGIGSMKPGPAIAGYVLMRGEALLFGEDFFVKAAAAFRREVEHFFGEEIAKRIDDETSALPTFARTQDCLECARRIADFLRRESEALQKALPASQAEASAAGGAESDGKERPSDSGSTEEGCSQASQPNDAQQQGGAASAAPAKRGKRSKEEPLQQPSARQIRDSLSSLDALSSEDFGEMPDISRSVGQALTAAAKRQSRRLRKLAASGHRFSGRSNLPARPKAQPLDSARRSDAAARGLQLIRQARSACRSLHKTLRRFVETQTRRLGWTASSGLRLSQPQLFRLAANDPKVFERRIEKRGVDTAVHLLVDFSGSMRDKTNGIENAELAMRAALALFMGFSSLQKVNPSLSIFKAKGLSNLVPHGSKRPEGFAQLIGSASAQGGTPLDSALWEADALLKQTRARRRILIVITDGMPDDFDATTETVEALEREGRELFAIGIGCGARVSAFFRNARTIDSIEELPEALFEGAEMLLGQGIRR